MANLIITVIAIALVAVASLMGAYYGGAAFLNNQSAANASTVLNESQQIAGAWQSYLGDNLNVAPTDARLLLVNNGYLSRRCPAAPRQPGVATVSAVYRHRLSSVLSPALRPRRITTPGLDMSANPVHPIPASVTRTPPPACAS